MFRIGLFRGVRAYVSAKIAPEYMLQGMKHALDQLSDQNKLEIRNLQLRVPQITGE